MFFGKGRGYKKDGRISMVVIRSQKYVLTERRGSRTITISKSSLKKINPSKRDCKGSRNSIKAKI